MGSMVYYIVKETGQNYAVVKRLGYSRLGETLGLSFDASHEKPIEVIRRNGWWKEGYRALWMAYQVDKRLTAGKNG